MLQQHQTHLGGGIIIPFSLQSNTSMALKHNDIFLSCVFLILTHLIVVSKIHYLIFQLYILFNLPDMGLFFLSYYLNGRNTSILGYAHCVSGVSIRCMSDAVAQTLCLRNTPDRGQSQPNLSLLMAKKRKRTFPPSTKYCMILEIS